MPVVTSEVACGQDLPAERAALLRIARTGSLFLISNMARGAIGLATSIVIARHLGADSFGRWTLCMAWASMLTFLLDLGFGVLLTRDAAADRRSASHLLAGALAARTALFVPAAVLFVAAAPWLGLPREPSLLIGLLMLAATGIAYGSIAAVFRAWPEKVPAILALETAGSALMFGAAWQIARHEMSVEVLLLLAATVQASQAVVAGMLLRKAASDGHTWQLPSIESAITLTRRAFPFAVSGIVANAQERLGLLMLGLLSGSAHIASFGAAWRIGAAARWLPQAALGGGLPVLAAEAASGRAEPIRSRFEGLLAAFAAAAATTLALFAAPLLRLTYGEEFVAGAPSLAWIGVGLLPLVVNSARKVGLYARGREAVAVRFSVLTLVIQVAGCAALVPRFGATGAALAMTAGEAIAWWPLRRYARATW